MVSTADSLAVQGFAQAWSVVAKAHGMKGCIPALAPKDPSRSKRILAALDLCPDVNVWRMAFLALASDPFYTGGGPRGWKAGIDFVLRDQNRLKILEMGMTAQEDEVAAKNKRESAQRSAASEHEDAAKRLRDGDI